MKTLRRVGVETGQLTDEELRYVDTRLVEAVRPALVARRLFPIFRLPHAGFTSVRAWKETDMGQASIDMHGITQVKDRIQLEGFDVKVPVIHKEFLLYWRDVIASRYGGLPIETRSVESAGIQCAEEEDKCMLSGEFTGFRALGIEGLMTATGRNTKASAGAWPANAITDVGATIGELEADKHYGPYALVLRSSWLAKLRALISNTGIFYLEKVAELVKAGIFVSDQLYTSGGLTTGALVVEPGQQNFEMVLGQDLTTFMQQDEDMNINGKVYEVVVPRVNRPTSIAEITGLT
jgi:uncharacterized linocin/CFP29 family protein